jgi:hypothetical protein
MSRDPSSLSTQLFDLLCVAVLGLILTLFAGMVARAAVPAHAAGTGVTSGAADADCPTAAKPEKTVAGGEPAMGGLPASMSAAVPCTDGSAAEPAPASPRH